MILRNIILFLTVLLILQACGGNESSENDNASQQNTSVEEDSYTDVRIEAFAVKNGFGYQIYLDGKIYISQPHIPGIQGLKPFESKEKATIAAQLVKQKIENKVLPPTVSAEELKQAGAID